LDVSDPTAPTEVRSYAISGSPKKILLHDCLAYVASAAAGLRVINVRDPASPVEVGTHDHPSRVWDVVVAGGMAYVTDGRVYALDMSDPTSPREAGTLWVPGNAVAVATAGEYLYVACRDGGLVILRMTP